MEGLIPVIIMIFVVISAVSNAKKKQEEAQKRQQQAQKTQAAAYSAAPQPPRPQAQYTPLQPRIQTPTYTPQQPFTGSLEPAPLAQPTPTYGGSLGPSEPMKAPSMTPAAPAASYGTYSAGKPNAIPEGRSGVSPKGAPRRPFIGTASAGRPNAIPEGLSGDKAANLYRPALQATDLGAQRARQNPQSAGNLLWEPPVDEGLGELISPTKVKATISAKELRQAILMKEILDPPKSRRRSVRT